MKTIPADLYAAAKVDGADAIQRFFHVTLPALGPSLALVIVYETMMAIRHFDLFFLLTEGGPGDASHVVAWRIYVETFRNLSFGTGAAMSYILALATLALAYVIIRSLGAEDRDGCARHSRRQTPHRTAPAADSRASGGR